MRIAESPTVGLLAGGAAVTALVWIRAGRILVSDRELAMTQKETLGDAATSPAIAMMHPEILDFARKRMDALLEVQKDFMQTLEGINHDWFNRAKAEAELASEFVGRLSAARSVPDATTTCQEWASRELELLAEDGRHMFANGEKIIQASRRLFSSNGH
jgi:phasin protein